MGGEALAALAPDQQHQGELSSVNNTYTFFKNCLGSKMRNMLSVLSLSDR